MEKIIQMKDSDGLIYPISNVYSTDEKLIGKWIDGKHLYRKTYYITTEGADITELNFDYIEISKASVITQNFIFPFARYTSENDRIDIFISKLNKTVNISLGSAWSSEFIGAYITLEYTKTTDQKER